MMMFDSQPPSGRKPGGLERPAPSTYSHGGSYVLMSGPHTGRDDQDAPTSDQARPQSRPPDGASSTPSRNATTKPRKQRATFLLPLTLLDEVRNAVVALSGPPLRMTLAGFAAEAFRAHLLHLQGRYNGGAAFSKRAVDLRGGRPIGS